MGWVREPSAVHSGWRVRWALKDLLVEEEDSATVARVARTMHERLEKLRVESWDGRWKDDEEIEQISDEFHTIGFVDGDESADVGHFNLVLDGLYDWADAERVLIS
jgi:hypothetical protein